MDVRNPLGILAIAILAAAVVQVAPGWPTFVSALSGEPPGVTMVATPGATTLTAAVGGRVDSIAGGFWTVSWVS
jgi:hypothetical protein